MRTRGIWIIATVLVVSVPALAVTDADRVQVYHDFRTAFDAHHYQDALPLAEKLVTLTEEQYGSADRSLVTPLANLGTTQYRLGDYKTAEQTYLRSVKIGEDSGGNADRLLLQPLHGLGATYYATGQYEDASVTLKKALDLSRNLDGLFNASQIEILDPLIASLVTLERHDEAERDYQYSVRIAESAYGKTDVRVLRSLDRYARWLERMGRYTTARALHARALSIAEQGGGRGTVLAVDPLNGIARTYRLEFVNGPEDDQQGPTGDPFAPGSDFAPSSMNTQRLNPDGERALLLALQAIDKAQPVDHLRRGVTLVELGDWYMSGGVGTKALQTYRDAWKDLSEGGSTAALATPRQLAYRAPTASITRSRLSERDNVEEHFVEASFTVTRDGRTTDVTTFASDAPESQQRIVVSAVKKARYAPRLENGEPVDTQGFKLRERLLSKKPQRG
jgi:tetratricopeptide (TPR) repeat protein